MAVSVLDREMFTEAEAARDVAEEFGLPLE
jgi:hypothetical protein